LPQGALFALGAYVTAMLCQTGAPWWVALFAAAVAVGAFSLLLAIPLLRLSHTYLALSTFAIALAIPQVLRHGAVAAWTGGAGGLQIERPQPPTWLPEGLGSDAWMYWIALILGLVLTWSLAKVLSGNTGLELRSVRDNATAAAAHGMNVSRVKSLAFGFSGMCAAVGGGLYALNVQYVSPDSFTVFLSLSMLVALVVGGQASAAGPWLGAAFLLYMPAWAERISTAAPWAIFGIAVLLTVSIAPRGLVGAWDSFLNYLNRSRSDTVPRVNTTK
jgi:branched-chain amino acid transport system permease protein